MANRKRLLILIPAITLILVLFWMIPLNLAHKLSGTCPLSKGSQTLKAGSCLSNSLISQHDSIIAGLACTWINRGPASPSDIHAPILDSFHFDASLASAHLRCWTPLKAIKINHLPIRLLTVKPAAQKWLSTGFSSEVKTVLTTFGIDELNDHEKDDLYQLESVFWVSKR